MSLGRILPGLALLLGELLVSLRPPSVTRRVAGFATVSKAVSAPLRRLLVSGRPLSLWRLLLARLLVARLLVALLLSTRPLLTRLTLALLVLTRLSLTLLALTWLSLAPLLLTRFSASLRELLTALRELLSRRLFSRDVTSLVSRLTPVSEAHLPSATPGPRGLTATLTPAADRDEDLLALHSLFYLLLDLFGTALVAPSSSLASFSASFLSASLSVSVVGHW